MQQRKKYLFRIRAIFCGEAFPLYIAGNSVRWRDWDAEHQFGKMWNCECPVQAQNAHMFTWGVPLVELCTESRTRCTQRRNCCKMLGLRPWDDIISLYNRYTPDSFSVALMTMMTMQRRCVQWSMLCQCMTHLKCTLSSLQAHISIHQRRKGWILPFDFRWMPDDDGE